MPRFLLYSVGFSILAAGLMYAMAVSAGLDPLAPQVRTISLLSLLAAAYVGIRGAMVLRGFERRRQARAEAEAFGEDSKVKKRSAFSRWGRNSALDARMEARRERLRRAQEKQEKSDEDQAG